MTPDGSPRFPEATVGLLRDRAGRKVFVDLAAFSEGLGEKDWRKRMGIELDNGQ